MPCAARWQTARRALAGNTSSVVRMPITPPMPISPTRQAAAVIGPMWTAAPPISTMAAVIGATLRLGRSAAANAAMATAALITMPSSSAVLARR